MNTSNAGEPVGLSEKAYLPCQLGARFSAKALAARITVNGPLAVQATKQLMLDEIGDGNPALLGQLQRSVFSSEDAKEGPRAFAEKRAPNWQGK